MLTRMQCFSCRSVKGGMWMFPIILHSCMCAFMTSAPIHLEASCRSSDDDENGSAPVGSSSALRNRNRHFMVARAWCDIVLLILLFIVLVIVSWFWCNRTRPRFAEVESASWPVVRRRSGGPRARVVAAGKVTQDRYDWLQQGGLSFWQ